MNNSYELEQNGLKCKLKVGITKDKVSHAYHNELKEICKKAQIKGFRPGKLPERIAEQRFGAQLISQIQQQFHEEAFKEGLEKHKLEVAGDVSLDNGMLEKAGPYNFAISFECLPEIDVNKVEGIKLNRSVCKVNEKLVDDEIKTLKDQYPEYKAVKRKSKKDDQVVMDFEGFIDGKPFENGSAKSFEYVVGSGKLLPEFDKKLVGVSKGDDLEIDLVFPDDYHAKEMVGKKANFKVTLHDVMQPKSPELNKGFFEKVGSDAKDLEAFKKQRQDKIQAEIDEDVRNLAVETLKETIVKKFKFDLPESMLAQEIKRLESQEADEKKRKKKAGEHLMVSLIFKAVMKAHDIQLDEDRFRNFLTKMSGPYAQNPEFIQWYMSDENRRQQIAALVLEEQIIDHILSKAVFTDKEIEYTKLKDKTKES